MSMTNEQFAAAAQPLMADDRVGMAEWNDVDQNGPFKERYNFDEDDGILVVEHSWGEDKWYYNYSVRSFDVAAAIIEKHLRDWLKKQGCYLTETDEWCEYLVGMQKIVVRKSTSYEAIIAAVTAVLEGM